MIISKVRRQQAAIALIEVKLQVSKAYMEQPRGKQCILVGRLEQVRCSDNLETQGVT